MSANLIVEQKVVWPGPSLPLVGWPQCREATGHRARRAICVDGCGRARF